jgi:hypothetical protein
MMKEADEPLGRVEREAGLPIGNKSSNGMRIPQKVEADFPESELPDEQAWEKERKTALALIHDRQRLRSRWRNASKCIFD